MDNDLRERFRRRSTRGRLFTGLLLLFIGAVTLLQKINNPFPEWLFSWPSLVIVMGIFVGLKRKFRGAMWLGMILLGGFFLTGDVHPEWHTEKYEVPAFLIALGLAFILRPKRDNCRDRRWGRWQEWHHEHPDEKKNTFAKPLYETDSGDDLLDIVSVLGGTKKVIMSQDFKGGEVTSFLGGTELNLGQADIKGRVVLELTQVMGGTKLIVPSHWDIKSELSSVFGSIEDKRDARGSVDPSKILVLKGSSVFGGIEIRNF